MLERVSDGCRRQRHVALSQSHQGQARLRIPPRLAGLEERLLRTWKVAQLQSYPSQLGQWPPELPPQVRSQLRTSSQGLLLGLGGRPAQPQDLGTVNPAAAMNAADTASVAPPLHGLGPLLGEVVLGEPLEHADQLAVDHPGRDGVEFTGDGGHTRLLDEIQAPTDLARQDHRMCLGHPTEGGRRGVAVRSRRDRPTRPFAGSAHVAHHQPLVAVDDRQPGVHRSLVVPLEQTLRPLHPAADRRHQRGVHQQVQGNPARRASRGERVTGTHRLRVRAFPRLDGHLEMAGRVGGLGQQPEIVDRQEGLLVGSDEQVVGPRPVTGGGRLASLLRPARFRSRRPPLTGPQQDPRPVRGNPEGYPRNSLPHAFQVRVESRCDRRRM